MAEWHLPPDYIVNNWTEELLNLMIEKMIERKKRESQAVSHAAGAVETGGRHGNDRLVSDTALFAQLGNRIKVVKK